eukprot:TRINITY_DN40837_c0_g2_i1.p1 TRINITY_DN40837_c0_g2~~TRINITY_DN40837_c0_g2_i1.p1  ORF type:complete len:516 (-),score=52.90 TRINITY_DN40837_c0_g2_i1:340-1800(-)
MVTCKFKRKKSHRLTVEACPVPAAGYVLLVKDHTDHGVGCSDSALDMPTRVTWAWNASLSTPWVKRGMVRPLQVDVQSRTVDGRRNGPNAKLLRISIAAADELLPLLAKSWDPSAPNTLRENVAEKLGRFRNVKDLKAVLSREVGKGSSDQSSAEQLDVMTVAEACSLPMTSLHGARRAAQAMLVTAIFAAELSERELAPVLVLGRPPGHHATCAHCLQLDAPPRASPGGAVEGRTLGGGCFYPSNWLAAVHSIRKGAVGRLAYIDVDAHKPDGIWKEVDHMRNLDGASRAQVLGTSDCHGVLFASVHVDGYPNPGGTLWTSARCVLPKGPRQAFEVRVHEKLLRGVGEGGATSNSECLAAYARWKDGVLEDLASFRPNGLFIGLGFDLHMKEGRVNDKREGIGLSGHHYRELLRSCLICRSTGPTVLTLEGGYTKAAVVDGVRGALAGMVDFSRSLSPRRITTTARAHLKRGREFNAEHRMKSKP